MMPRSWITGRPGKLLALLVVIVMVAGCAGTSGGNQPTAAAIDPEEQCRSAITGVNKMCAGDGGESRDCEAAKSRARDLCIESE
jgi:hypothetical protein